MARGPTARADQPGNWPAPGGRYSLHKRVDSEYTQAVKRRVKEAAMSNSHPTRTNAPPPTASGGTHTESEVPSLDEDHSRPPAQDRHPDLHRISHPHEQAGANDHGLPL